MTRILQSALVEGFEWTIERYHRAIAAGVLTQEDRVELLRGDLIETMPIGENHAGTVEGLGEYFSERIGGKYRLRSENPVTLPDNSEPEPDYVVARKLPRHMRKHHPTPTDIFLLIEVAQRTVDKDRNIKGPIYAAAGIPEYWIINLERRLVEVHTQPSDDGVYHSVVHYGEHRMFDSPFMGETAVDDLLLPL